jgi:hypothetical protein
VLVLDIDEAESAKVLATLDPLAAMAEVDAGKFDSLSQEIDTGCDALRDMLAAVANGAGLGDSQVDAPDEFAEVDENIPIEHTCPKCGYRWSGGQ